MIISDLETVSRNLDEMYPKIVLKHLTDLPNDINAPLEYFTNSLPALFTNNSGVSVIKK